MQRKNDLLCVAPGFPLWWAQPLTHRLPKICAVKHDVNEYRQVATDNKEHALIFLNFLGLIGCCLIWIMVPSQLSTHSFVYYIFVCLYLKSKNKLSILSCVINVTVQKSKKWISWQSYRGKC